jgi:hypothetical protein
MATQYVSGDVQTKVDDNGKTKKEVNITISENPPVGASAPSAPSEELQALRDAENAFNGENGKNRDNWNAVQVAAKAILKKYPENEEANTAIAIDEPTEGGRRRKSAKRANKKRRSTKKSKGGKKSKRSSRR